MATAMKQGSIAVCREINDARLLIAKHVDEPADDVM